MEIINLYQPNPSTPWDYMHYTSNPITVAGIFANHEVCQNLTVRSLTMAGQISSISRPSMPTGIAIHDGVKALKLFRDTLVETTFDGIASASVVNVALDGFAPSAKLSKYLETGFADDMQYDAYQVYIEPSKENIQLIEAKIKNTDPGRWASTVKETVTLNNGAPCVILTFRRQGTGIDMPVMIVLCEKPALYGGCKLIVDLEEPKAERLIKIDWDSISRKKHIYIDRGDLSTEAALANLKTKYDVWGVTDLTGVLSEPTVRHADFCFYRPGYGGIVFFTFSDTFSVLFPEVAFSGTLRRFEIDEILTTSSVEFCEFVGRVGCHRTEDMSLGTVIKAIKKGVANAANIVLVLPTYIHTEHGRAEATNIVLQAFRISGIKYQLSVGEEKILLDNSTVVSIASKVEEIMCDKDYIAYLTNLSVSETWNETKPRNIPVLNPHVANRRMFIVAEIDGGFIAVDNPQVNIEDVIRDIEEGESDVLKLGVKYGCIIVMGDTLETVTERYTSRQSINALDVAACSNEYLLAKREEILKEHYRKLLGVEVDHSQFKTFIVMFEFEDHDRIFKAKGLNKDDYGVFSYGKNIDIAVLNSVPVELNREHDRVGIFDL